MRFSSFIVLVATLVFLGAGCTTAQKTDITTSPQTPGTPSWATSTPLAENPGLLDLYKKWAIPASVTWEVENNERDCVGLVYGMNNSGDLISALIVDEKRANSLDLDVYTPDYLQNMDRVMAYYTKKKYGKNFFAFSVCHLGKNIDVASGNVTEDGRTDRNTKQIALLRAGENVYELEGVQLYNNTATGAEVYPCSAKIIGSKAGQYLVWSCFQGLHKVSEGQVAGSDMKEWTFTMEGKLVRVEERVEP